MRKLGEDDEDEKGKGDSNNYPTGGLGPEFRSTSLTSRVAKMLSASLMNEDDDV